MDREPYTTGGAMYAISGSMTGWYNGHGQLPPEWAERYRADEQATVYTVISYRTPIAWVLESGEVVIPDAKYSRTTTGHQGLLYALKLKAGDPESLDARSGIRGAAQRERETARQARAIVREPTMGAIVRERTSLLRQERLERVALGARRTGLANPDSIESHNERSRAETERAPAAPVEDPTASLMDRMAALEAETFAQISSTASLIMRSRAEVRAQERDDRFYLKHGDQRIGQTD
jgi:hypothetical protein